MKLFSRIPERFFSILTSPKKELYVQALFVLRQAFKTELVIRRDDLAAMLMNSLEDEMTDADFSEEAREEGENMSYAGLSAKAYLLLRKLKACGWIETEYETRSFDENITIPDYAIAVINLLYDLSEEKVREYNSYVYATYATLSGAENTPEYLYQALAAAYQNTVNLVDELKSLFNNIRRYYQRIPLTDDVNLLLEEHFDVYRTQIFDTVYYPLKTIDSVPRFKHAILSVINRWMQDEEIVGKIAGQGVQRRVFADEEAGFTETMSMLGYIADTYDGIEEMIEEIDRKHREYTNASVEHMRYLMNADRGVKGKLIDLLRNAEREDVAAEMERAVAAQRYAFYDDRSLYDKVRRTRKTEGAPLAVSEGGIPQETLEAFLAEARRQYSDRRIDGAVEKWFGDKAAFEITEISIENQEDFICLLLGTIRGQERSAPYRVTFENAEQAAHYLTISGYVLPAARFEKRRRKDRV